ncbi:uncharacterized protein LOC117282693 [Cryptotermes secundus]|uniref:uncharacterized protein LOC117282693 n=1 Tax=Cryptotermes secundus TaxID=105785 RepID=UPI001454DDD5|nr:uncharacterized protein LOC117282693 [Cryptotermes secundus]
MGGYKIVVAVFSFAYIVLLSANHGSGLSIGNPVVCPPVRCVSLSCGVKNASDCHTGEQYVPVHSRGWCGCCYANCCGACVQTVAVTDIFNTLGYYVRMYGPSSGAQNLTCHFTTCFGITVPSSGIGDNCSASYDGYNGHYKVCPGGLECSHDSNKCVRTISTTTILP